MIIYGSRSAHIGNIPSKSAKCENCNSERTITFNIFRRHAHIFWIPLFPIGKTGVAECSYCKQVLRKNEMPETLKREYVKARNIAKGPKWQYAGLFLILALFVFVGFSSKISRNNEAKYITEPLIGDVYSYKTETNQYSTMKVDSVSNDSVFVYLNNYEIGRKSKIYKIEKADRYSENTYAYSKKEIIALYEEKTIVSIDR